MNRYDYIAAYVRRVCAGSACQIMIKDFIGFTARDPAVAAFCSPYCIHKSPFCLYMKGCAGLWEDCQQASARLIKRCGQGNGAPFNGVCYAGFAETVLPVLWNDRPIACICVGGLDVQPEKSRTRIHKICADRNLDEQRVLELYAQSANAVPESPEEAVLSAGVLADFLSMYYTALVNVGAIDPEQPYIADTTRLSILTNTLEFIHLHFDQDVRLPQIAEFCGCSESYISHLFKRNMKKSVSEYVNAVRVERARHMLARETGCLREIALRCGFGDPNYFSTVFRRITGFTPSEYRHQYQSGGARA